MCSKYIQTAKDLADQFIVTSKPIADDDLIHFLINGLNPTFHMFVTTFSLITQDNFFSFDEFHHALLNHERLINQQHTTAKDISTFALFTNKANHRHFPLKSKPQQPYNSSHQQYHLQQQPYSPRNTN
jgi:arylsulfatase A-like enzyme